MIGLRSRLAVALLVFGLCLVYALPSVPYIGTALENVLPSKKINLGLDLKGGIHLTLGVDVAKAVSNSLALAGQDIRRLAKDEKIVVLHPRVVGNDKLEFALPRVDDEAKLQEILQKNFPQLNVGEPRRTEAGLRYVAEFRPEEISRIEDMALDQALRTIRNRIDQFGVAEPDIRKQEGNRIQVQLPGLSDPRRAVQILGQTAHLEFHLVRDDVDPNKAVLPSGVMALPLLEKGHDGSETATRLIAVEKDAMLSGEDVADAQPTFEKNRASVSLSFNSRGATLFENVTGENVGRRMAIVLDDKVYSAPVIQQRIAGGRAVITGQFTTQEATDLAIVLRAGSLAAPMEIVEERLIGPSLGADNIAAGFRSTLYGFGFVAVFMILYYQVFGIVTAISLMCNVMCLVALLSMLQATLTLPGIAAIALTLGMAVDSNVLINERIREELRIGRTPQLAISEGYGMAFATIVDSNVTSLIAGIALLIFGSGPVRGFAVVHCLGIMTSLFTSVIVSRSMVNFIYGRQKKLTRVHIGQVWRPDTAQTQSK